MRFQRITTVALAAAALAGGATVGGAPAVAAQHAPPTAVSGTTLASCARTWTGRRLSSSHTYRVRVSAVNRAGSGPAAELVAWTAS